MKTSIAIIATMALIASLLAGCDSGPRSGRGFRLPDGDPAKGKDAFIALQCNNCHTVDGVELPAPTAHPDLQVVIGGKVAKIKTYGELVTSVINPSHDISPGFDHRKPAGAKKSPMPDYTQVMTARQLIDIVAFLQSHYVQLEPAPYYYPGL